jgi:hypothetical protein
VRSLGSGDTGSACSWIPLWACTVIGLAAVAPTNTSQAQTLSPGPLSAPHASLDHADRCGDCHSTGREVGEDRCLKCHKKSGAGPNLHGRLVRDSGKGCGDCHPEHNGRNFHLVRLDAHVPGFTHDITGFSLEGKHKGLACEKCHSGKDRFHGASDRCGSCHKDRHGGQFKDDCAQCHDARGFAGASRFDHGKAWPLEGRHRLVPCTKCHADRDGKDRRWIGLPRDTCDSCHKDPHGGSMKRPCSSCHSVDGWKMLSETAGLDHAAGRFPLEGRHRSVPCAKCHGEKMERKAEARCASCHAEPHEGRMGSRCEQCHDAAGWRLKVGATFDHDRTGYPLAGRHALVACIRCHGREGSYKGRFRGKAHGACRDCHEDTHRTAFTSVEGGDRCDACHAVERFSPSSYTLDDHDRSTFPLTGAHRAVPCGARCHRPTGGKTGLAGLTLSIPAKACADCHADPHGGAFKDRSAGKGCGACHSTTSWKAADFDHSTTRFPLEGRHRNTPCAACHGLDHGGADTGYKGLERRCASCHEDPHAGQFTGLPARDCGDCHGTEGFKIGEFDHGTRTGFAIEGAHGKLACAACHPAVILPWGGETPLYRPVSRACGTCHADPHRGRTDGNACDDCHRATAWLDVADGSTYDHRRAGFPLTGAHATLSCRQCHDGTLPGTEGGNCVACHRDPHRGAEGEACDRCHTPAGWAIGEAVRNHERTRFPLTGAHRVADCASCHAAVEPPMYAGTPRECIACHEQDARRPGMHPDHALAGFPSRCEQCHGTFAWGIVRVTHSWWPLRGAHAAVECFRCHGNDSYSGTPDRCEDCHKADYDRVSSPSHTTLGFSRDCRECHRESAWSPALGGWHDRLFPLRGDHRSLECADCHTGGSTSTFTCTGCHAHEKTRMDSKHRGKGGYVYESTACLSCHPRGDD